MAEANVKITTDLKAPKELGTYYRLICMTGPSKGKVFYLNGKRIIIGRGDKVDVQILDTKMSREHAELSLTNGEYTITDLSNQNGIVINDLKVKQKKLIDGEKIVLGQSVLKYSIIEIKEAHNDLAIIEDNVLQLNPKDARKIETKVKTKAKIANDSDDPPVAPKKNNKMIIMIIFLGAVFFFLFGDDPPPKAGKMMSKEEAFNIESQEAGGKKSLSKEDPEVKRKFDMLIHSGRREFREGNYFRAMEEFRRADLLIPNSGMAGFLMSRAKQRLDEDVVKNFDKANKDLDAKKFQSAIISYCGVMQLLQKYPDDERYKNAQEKINALETELGLEKGEVKCFEEKPADTKN